MKIKDLRRLELEAKDGEKVVFEEDFFINLQDKDYTDVEFDKEKRLCSCWGPLAWPRRFWQKLKS